MKERALQLVDQTPRIQRKNVLREYLQAHILRSIGQDRGFECLAFLGGTALRFLFQLQRYSEDLDFSLERKKGYDFHSILDRVTIDLEKAGFDLTLHLSAGKVVNSAFLRFPRLLYEAGLSAHPEEKLSIKIEIDTNPPSGAGMESHVINRYFLLPLWHYDLPSMMAGKIHAFLSRGFIKGRDVYDLLWYRSRPEPAKPNLKLLRNALRQTEGDKWNIKENNWKDILKDSLSNLDWEEVVADVEPFLENPEERKLLTYHNLVSVL